MATEDEKDDDPHRWAADEPTAMWSDADMADSGYQQLVADRAAKPRESTGPATTREVGGERKAAVEVSRELTGAHATHPRPAPAPAKGASALSWALTVGLAVVLGVAVYFAVRLLR